ncbi:MAG: DNA methyltransferase [Chloracidobacterium sp.]|nr:DNA methyltransferase [Chloracidobacterium sp.]MDW8216284.1 DNA methyltransferase [Acidobacteriota bacterium]
MSKLALVRFQVMKNQSLFYGLPLLDSGKGSQETRKSERISPLNDIDLNRWREYDDIITDSLWLIPERDRSGAHLADYHGNFVPQIPYQAMRRFTKRGDIVFDAFLGSGTSLIEARRLGRHGIGIELKPELAQKAADRIFSEQNPHNVITKVLTGDSSDTTSMPAVIARTLEEMGKEKVQLVFLHPPYHSIIKFSNLAEDLSNCPSIECFLEKFSQVVEIAKTFLESGRFLVLVIGDIYAESEWIPLGFYCMQEVMKWGLTLKSIVVKDIQGNRAKRNLENMWRYRALAGGFYIFKHEYVMFFQKSF